MGEGVVIYSTRMGYTRSLQDFTKKVLQRPHTNNSLYVFGRANKAILQYLSRNGIRLETDKVAITDKTIVKYKDHPKREKGATVSFNRMVMVEKAVKHPKNVYIDTNRKRLVFVATTKYEPNRVLKVIVEPNQRMGKRYFHKVVSIGVVDKTKMDSPQYVRVK